MANSPTDDAAKTPPPASADKGAASRKDTEGQRRPRLRPQPSWLIFVLLVVGNYFLTKLFFPEPASITVSYTFFKNEVEAGNVDFVTSAGDFIRGSFKKEVTYWPEA